MSESDVCRFCGYKGSDLRPIIDGIYRFYKILPDDITRDDANMPQTLCQLCELKIFEILEFFDRVAEVDRDLRQNITTSPNSNFEWQQLPSPSGMQSQTELVDNIVNKIKVKSEISIKKISGGQSFSSYTENVDPLDISNDASQFESELCADDSENENFGKEDEALHSSESDSKSPTLLAKRSKRYNLSNGSEMVVIDVSNSKYVCCRCRESFHSAALLRHHLFVASACHDAELVCKYCGKKFDTRRKRGKHESFHENKKSPVHHECSKCARKFVSLSLLAIHRRKCKGEIITNRLSITFKCTECGEKFNSSTQLMNHTDNHAISKKKRKNLVCEICGQTFDRKPLYHDHIRIHPELAKFECDLCEKKFHTAILLKAHRHEHSGIKSFVCSDCGKTFVQKTSLNDHRRSHHTGETPFPCTICGKHFSTVNQLRVHQYKHIFKN